MQQQLGRSPIQMSNQQQLNSNILSSPGPNLNLLTQSSPYTSRFNSSNNQQSMMNMMRSPSNPINSNSINLRQQLQHQQLHNDVLLIKLFSS